MVVTVHLNITGSVSLTVRVAPRADLDIVISIDVDAKASQQLALNRRICS